MASPLSLAELEAAVQSQARGLGAHYTPHAVAERIARATLGPLCAGLSPHEVLGLRVLDPAVGSGRFLVAALDVLARAVNGGPGFRRLVATRCLFGIDVDPRAVGLARRVVAEAGGCAPDELSRNVVAGDSLLADTAALLGVEAFDAVLTNPPWVSYSGRQAGALEPERRRLLAERFASFRGWPTTHGAFLELAAGLLRPGGRAALVLPEQVCHLAGYGAARRAALARCRLEPPPESLGEACFDGVVQPAAIIFLHRAPGVERGVDGGMDDWMGGRAPARRSVPDGVAAAILGRMRRHPPAPKGTFRDPGVHTGNSAALVLHDEASPGLVPVREGRCVHPFRLDAAGRWLDPAPRLPAGRYCRIRPAAAYLGARLLVRQTANRPIAARHADPAHFRNSILACYGIPGLDDAALLGLLNSGPAAFYHRSCHPDSGQRAFPQVKVAHLQALPIARDAAEAAPLARRLEALAAEPAGRGREWRETRRRLDRLACRLYGLGEDHARYVEGRLGE